jgi:hypothetical protein
MIRVYSSQNLVKEVIHLAIEALKQEENLIHDQKEGSSVER